MNTNETALLDPFEVTTPDEATERSALVRALELAEGFHLLFVCCNQIPQRERLMEDVRARLPKLNIQTLFFREPIPHLLDAIRAQLTMPPPDVLFVSGLEFSLPDAAEAHATPLIANLNASRNSFAKTLPCPVVLWVPEYVMRAIMQGAPDFFSIRSGVYFFTATPAELDQLAQGLFAGEYLAVSNLPKAEKADRIVAIKRLLADYELLPDKHRDRSIERALIEQLGDLLYTKGEYDAAIKQHAQALQIAEELGNRADAARSLHRVGMIYEARGEYESALAAYSQSLKIKEDLGDRRGAASSLHQMGSIDVERGEYDAAIARYEDALRIFEELDERAGVSASLHNIGIIHQRRGEYQMALERYEQALKIEQELGDWRGTAVSLHQIGMIHYVRGEYEAALAHYERVLRIFEELDDHAGVSDSLHSIGIIHQRRGEFEAAKAAYKQSLQIKQELGDRKGAADTHGQLGQLFTSLNLYPEAFTHLRLALIIFAELRLPATKHVVNDLKNLRTKWGSQNFDIAWQEATGESVSGLLL